jgi:hypothetical protein
VGKRCGLQRQGVAGWVRIPKGAVGVP